jgi:tetratricopeptide (TPR) repeat protein
LIWFAAAVGTSPAALAQSGVGQHLEGAEIRGIVSNSAQQAVMGAIVRLNSVGTERSLETRTDADGRFTFSALSSGEYVLIAEKSGVRSLTMNVILAPGERSRQLQLSLKIDQAPESKDIQAASPQPPTAAMEFADQPSFTVAGVTDWTAAGGHGSDAILRTSETLTRDTLTLKPADQGKAGGTDSRPAGNPETLKEEKTLQAAQASAPGSFDSNRKLGRFYLEMGRFADAVPWLQTAYRIEPENRDNQLDLVRASKGAGDLHQARAQLEKFLSNGDSAEARRLAGEVDEQLGDPLAAVHEFEQAVHLDPSERNYFEWGSELLLHRAVWQAKDVFEKGSAAYPKSARLLSALGTALFAGARYQDAALRLCAASDLNPSNTEPYLFMGKVVLAAPDALPCIEQRLATFVQLQPDSSIARFFYAMAIWKRLPQPLDADGVKALRQVESLLDEAVTIDPKCADGFLQLGILYASQRNLPRAIEQYRKAIEANPQLGDAHYRLGVAYDRTGQTEKAQLEFQLHDQLEKQQQAAIENQRKEIKQFLIVLDNQPTSPASHP